MRVFLAHYLFVLAAWTLVIKFAFPISWALVDGDPALSLVWWDFWWVAHIWLGIALLRRPRHLFPLALAVAIVEVVIVVTKFVLFLPEPEWTIWSTNWFINKVFVLGVFILMLGHMARAPDEYRGAVRPQGFSTSGATAAASAASASE